MRIAFLARMLAMAGFVLLPVTGWAADCGPLKLINQVQLRAAGEGRRELISVSINGSEKTFLLDTGTFVSAVSQSVVKELDLPMRQGNTTLYTMGGGASSYQAAVNEFGYGRAKIHNSDLSVLNLSGIDGLLGLDFLGPYDADLDFGSDMLRIFSQDHCEGGVLYWQAPAIGVVPFRVLDGHLTVPVTLDGRQVNAIIDTGSPRTDMSQDTARYVFSLTLGAPGVEEAGDFANDPKYKIYSHTFDSLSFGDITVKNPRMTLVPDLIGRGGERQQQAGNRAKLYSDEIKLPELIIGMNILRKLHIYMAFKEQRLYVSPASVAGAQVAPEPGSPSK